MKQSEFENQLSQALCFEKIVLVFKKKVPSSTSIRVASFLAHFEKTHRIAMLDSNEGESQITIVKLPKFNMKHDNGELARSIADGVESIKVRPMPEPKIELMISEASVHLQLSGGNKMMREFVLAYTEKVTEMLSFTYEIIQDSGGILVLNLHSLLESNKNLDEFAAQIADVVWLPLEETIQI